MYTSVFFAGCDGGVVVSPGVHASGSFQHFLGAEMDAKFATLAAVRDQVHLTVRDAEFLQVERLSIENSHANPLQL